VAPAVPVHVLGIPARFIPHSANQDHILGQLGLDADGIVRTIRERC
jgi:deoxyxylulose-5-phosphate synthase